MAVAKVVYIFIGVDYFSSYWQSINYVNLSNASAIQRAKEVAIRKTVGASREKLYVNFILSAPMHFSCGIRALALLIVHHSGATVQYACRKATCTVSLPDPARTPLIVFAAWMLLGFFLVSTRQRFSSFRPRYSSGVAAHGKGTWEILHLLPQGTHRVAIHHLCFYGRGCAYHPPTVGFYR